MRSYLRTVHVGAISASLLVSGCTTLGSGVAVGPPGINRYAFRECLLDKGFYSPQALSGIALADWHYRHTPMPDHPTAKPAKAPLSRYALLEQSSPAFLARAATIITNGLMPALEYDSPDPGPVDEASVQGKPTASHADGGVNHPYVTMAGPRRYDEPDRQAPWTGHEQANPSVGDSQRIDWRLNRFLDCYIAPVGGYPAGDKTTGSKPATAATASNPIPKPPPGKPASTTPAFVLTADDDNEGRLLRAHILLVLLAKFGTEMVISHSSSRQVAQAEMLLGHITEAEAALRTDSLIMTATTRQKFAGATFVSLMDKDGTSLSEKDGTFTVLDEHGNPTKGADDKPVIAKFARLAIEYPEGRAQPYLRWRRYATRLLRVFQVGVDDQRIDARQTLERGGNLIAAFSGPLSGFLPVLKDGLAGVITMQKTRFYGDAYLRDARESLDVARFTTVMADRGFTYDVASYQAAWKLWDDELTSTCTVLATVAKKDDAGCIAKAAAAKTDGAGS